MKPHSTIIALSSLALSAAVGVAETEKQPSQAETSKADAATVAKPDMIRFTNHDTLHGKFLHFTAPDSLKWRSPESPDPITFHTKKLHRIVLNQGRAKQSLKVKSSTHLINGDVIPGEIVSANPSSVTLNSELLGEITIPRSHIRSIAPCPFGGELLYYGPLDDDQWETVNVKGQGAQDAMMHKKALEGAGELPPDDKALENWTLISNAWYSGSKASNYLVRKDALPDQCKLSFKASWRNSFYANLILHADFDPPAYEGEEDFHSSNASSAVGKAYVLSLTSHSVSLKSITFDEDGKPVSNRHDTTRPSLGLSGKTSCQIEVRIDRPNKSILLYCDGSFRGKWDLGDKYLGTGNHLAFQNLRYNHADLRISEIAICKWNGMKDSAESMSSAEHDVMLLTNGVDRFAGKLNKLENGKAYFTGTFDHKLTVPLNEIEEIHFSTKQQKPIPETAATASYFYMYPHGRITGTPKASSPQSTTLVTDLLGEVELNTHYINLIDFSHTNSLLDFWDDNF